MLGYALRTAPLHLTPGSPTLMNRIFNLHSPLGDQLLFAAHSGTEEMSRIFTTTLTAASLDKDIPLNAILGQNVTIEVELQTRATRYFNAHVIAFKQVKRKGRYHVY